MCSLEIGLCQPHTQLYCLDECGEEAELALKMRGQTWGLIFFCTFPRMQLLQTNSNPWYQCLKGRAISFHESPSPNNELFNTKLIVSAHCSVRDFVTCLTSTRPSGENSSSAKRNRKVMLHPRQQDVLLCFQGPSKHHCMVGFFLTSLSVA